MRLLFDQGTPAHLRAALLGHDVATAYEQRWSTLRNGDLLPEAERAGFDVFVTTDMNLRYQQTLSTRRIGIVAINTTTWPRIRVATSSVVHAIDQAASGSDAEVSVP